MAHLKHDGQDLPAGYFHVHLHAYIHARIALQVHHACLYPARKKFRPLQATTFAN